MNGGWGFPSQRHIGNNFKDNAKRRDSLVGDMKRLNRMNRRDILIVVGGSIASLLLVFFLFIELVYVDNKYEKTIAYKQRISVFDICNDGERYGLPSHSRFFRQREERRTFCKEILKK